MTDNDNIFSDINWDEGSDNPFSLEPGIHKTTISNATIERSVKGNLGLWLTFSDAEGKSIRKWATMPEASQSAEDYKRNTSFLRLLLRNLEIPESEWSSLEPDSFIGIDAVVTVSPQRNAPEFNQVGKIVRTHSKPDEDDGDDKVGAYSF